MLPPTQMSIEVNVCWSVGSVARSAGISTRTLRHYDALGLLVADRDPGNGYRVYRRSHLFRLQRILLLRSLGLPLPTVADVLSGEVEDATALKAHLEQIEAEQARLERVARTLRATLVEVSGGPSVDNAALFDGFEQQRDRLEERLVARFGSDVRAHFDRAAAITDEWELEDMAAAAASGRRLLAAFAALRDEGVPPHDEQVAPLVEAHREGVRAFWDASTVAYRNLADVLVDDPSQRALIDEVQPGLAPWLREAILSHTPG